MTPRLLIAATALLLGACSGGSGPTDTPAPEGGPAEPSQSPSQTDAPNGSLTVHATYERGEGGGLYTEGAVATYRLTDAQGNRVPPTSVDETEQTYADLPRGDYKLWAAQRPCDGNCSVLDPPQDGCVETLTVTGDLTVTVRFRVGEPCGVLTPR